MMDDGISCTLALSLKTFYPSSLDRSDSANFDYGICRMQSFSIPFFVSGLILFACVEVLNLSHALIQHFFLWFLIDHYCLCLMIESLACIHHVLSSCTEHNARLLYVLSMIMPANPHRIASSVLLWFHFVDLLWDLTIFTFRHSQCCNFHFAGFQSIFSPQSVMYSFTHFMTASACCDLHHVPFCVSPTQDLSWVHSRTLAISFCLLWLASCLLLCCTSSKLNTEVLSKFEGCHLFIYTVTHSPPLTRDLRKSSLCTETLHRHFCVTYNFLSQFSCLINDETCKSWHTCME